MNFGLPKTLLTDLDLGLDNTFKNEKKTSINFNNGLDDVFIF